MNERQNASGPVREVLVIETPGRHSTLQRVLTEAGFRVQVANSGHLAASLAKKNAPDIVLLRGNIGPPGASEIARAIKSDPATSDLPVVLLDGEPHPPPFAYPTEARLAHDVDDGDIVRTLRMITARPRKVRYAGARRETAPLQGRLECDDSPNVLQFLFATRKTGRVVVDDGAKRRGFVSIDNGDVVGAALGARFGVAAFSEMCFLRAGQFRFEPRRVSPDGSMREPGLELLLESARRKDMDDREHALAVGEATVRMRIASPLVTRHVATGATLPSWSLRSKLGAAALVLVGLCTGSLFARATLDRTPPTVSLEIVSEPPGARVFVDERDVGTTPVASVALEPGKRLIRLDREGSETTVELIDVSRADHGRMLRFALAEKPKTPAVLQLRRLPSRAKVYVDGVRQDGARAELAPGSYRVEIEAVGFRRWTERIELEPAMRKVLEVDLRPAE